MNALIQMKKFFEMAAEQELCGTDQLLYLHLLNRFNGAFWAETLQISDRELQESMRLYDSTGKPAALATIRKARLRLKQKGFIDFESGNGANFTEYRLVDLSAETKESAPKKTVLSLNSPEVLKAWDDLGGVRLTGGIAFGLIELENQYGTAALLDAIETAGKSNNRPHLSLNFLKAILANRGANGDGIVVKRVAEGWENQRPAWLDE